MTNILEGEFYIVQTDQEVSRLKQPQVAPTRLSA